MDADQHSDSRITAFDGQTVSFRYRKPGKPGQRKPRYGTATVAVDEFIRRFLLHALPERLHRIRHFGILANSCRARTLESVREALGAAGCTLADHGAVDDLDGEEVRNAGTAAPVICPHCGAVLPHVNEIPRQQPSHRTRAPPGTRQNQTPQP